jgi:DNA-binding transcriptional LysR family regulator
MLDMKRLRVLHAVSSYGSVSAAAAALGFSSPAISQQISALEREIGMPLTERVGRGIALTPAADILVSHTDVLLAQLEAAEAEVSALGDQIVGGVAIGAFPSAAATVVSSTWAALAESAPQLQLELHEMEPEESLPAVLRGELDVAVAHEYDVLPRPLDIGFERRELRSDPVCVAVQVDSGLGADGTVDVRSLAALPFLAPRVGTSCAEMTQRACAQAGFVPHVVARATDFQVLLSLVGNGAGVALVPRLAAGHVPASVRLLTPVASITRRIFTVSRRGGDRRPAVRVVLDALCAWAP